MPMHAVRAYDSCHAHRSEIPRHGGYVERAFGPYAKVASIRIHEVTSSGLLERFRPVTFSAGPLFVHAAHIRGSASHHAEQMINCHYGYRALI